MLLELGLRSSPRWPIPKRCPVKRLIKNNWPTHNIFSPIPKFKIPRKFWLELGRIGCTIFSRQILYGCNNFFFPFFWIAGENYWENLSFIYLIFYADYSIQNSNWITWGSPLMQTLMLKSTSTIPRIFAVSKAVLKHIWKQKEVKRVRN